MTLDLRFTAAMTTLALLFSACVKIDDAPPAAAPTPTTPTTPPPPPAKTVAIAANATYTIIGVGSGKCLEPADDRALQIRTCHPGSKRQRFKITPTDGVYHQLRNVETDLCVDVEGASGADGSRVILYPCGSQPNQQWALGELSPGVANLLARHSGKPLDIFGAATADGTAAIQWGANQLPNQQFRLEIVKETAVPAAAATKTRPK